MICPIILAVQDDQSRPRNGLCSHATCCSPELTLMTWTMIGDQQLPLEASGIVPVKISLRTRCRSAVSVSYTSLAAMKAQKQLFFSKNFWVIDNDNKFPPWYELAGAAASRRMLAGQIGIDIWQGHPAHRTTGRSTSNKFMSAARHEQQREAARLALSRAANARRLSGVSDDAQRGCVQQTRLWPGKWMFTAAALAQSSAQTVWPVLEATWTRTRGLADVEDRGYAVGTLVCVGCRHPSPRHKTGAALTSGCEATVSFPVPRARGSGGRERKELVVGGAGRNFFCDRVLRRDRQATQCRNVPPTPWRFGPTGRPGPPAAEKRSSARRRRRRRSRLFWAAQVAPVAAGGGGDDVAVSRACRWRRCGQFAPVAAASLRRPYFAPATATMWLSVVLVADGDADDGDDVRRPHGELRRSRRGLFFGHCCVRGSLLCPRI